MATETNSANSEFIETAFTEEEVKQSGSWPGPPLESCAFLGDEKSVEDKVQPAKKMGKHQC